MVSWVRSRLGAYYKAIYRIVAFVAAGVIMMLSFPEVETYKFEYELQRPWRHEEVIAPFDFPIYKTDSEIAAERDSLTANFRPIYRRDSVHVADVNRMVDKMLRDYSEKFTLICPGYVNVDSVRHFMANRLSAHLRWAFDTGVVTLPEMSGNDPKPTNELMLLTGNVMEPYGFEELLTMSEAYSEVMSKMKHDMTSHFGHDSSWPLQLLEQLPISELIEVNVVYDKAKTDDELQAAIDNMTVSTGKVFAGQRIIGTGEIVDKRVVKVLDSLKKNYETQYGFTSHSFAIYVGEFFIVGCLLACLYMFLYFFRLRTFARLRDINFILLLMTVFVVLSGVATRHNIDISFVVPYVILPVIMRTFLDARLAVQIHIMTILIISFFAPNSQLFILLQIPAGLVSVVSLINMSRRVQVVRAALLVLITYAVMYTGFCLWHSGEIEGVKFYPYLMFMVNGIFITLSYPLIYVFERTFGYLSDVTLMELSDTNHPLLRELSEKAPGTFQHSVQVANLAQEAAYRIGANAMLVRAGAMYHDVGKMVMPMYFTENQAGGINPHNGMDYVESARIVISHVANGVKIAHKHNIPQQVIDIIQSHHGDTQARYFYVAWCNSHQGEEPNLADFTYSGPTPKTKEEAIIMMADAIEASSKSLPAYTDDAIDALVDKIISMQVEMRQFRNAPITLRDIEITKQTYKEKLKNIYHARIQYPELLK